jgi:hypothetical protein
MSGLSTLVLLLVGFLLLASLALVARHALMIFPFVVAIMYFVWSRPDRNDDGHL